MKEQTIWLMTMVVMAIILLSIVRTENYKEVDVPKEIEYKPDFNILKNLMIRDFGMFKVDISPGKLARPIDAIIDKDSVMKVDVKSIIPNPKPPGYERLFR